MRQEITDINEAMNMLSGIDGGQVENITFVKLIVEVVGMRNIDKEIEDFIKSIQDIWNEEPLDGDDTEKISKRILSELDFQNANM